MKNWVLIKYEVSKLFRTVQEISCGSSHLKTIQITNSLVFFGIYSLNLELGS